MSKKIYWGGRFDDIWWLEYLEEEFEPSMENDLEILLENSPADRKRVKQLERTRHLIKESDEVALPEDGHFYTDLHDRIMAAVEEDCREDEIGDEKDATTSEDVADDSISETKRSWTATVWCAFARRWVQPKKLDFVR